MPAGELCLGRVTQADRRGGGAGSEEGAREGPPTAQGVPPVRGPGGKANTGAPRPP